MEFSPSLDLRSPVATVTWQFHQYIFPSRYSDAVWFPKSYCFMAFDPLCRVFIDFCRSVLINPFDRARPRFPKIWSCQEPNSSVTISSQADLGIPLSTVFSFGLRIEYFIIHVLYSYASRYAAFKAQFLIQHIRKRPISWLGSASPLALHIGNPY